VIFVDTSFWLALQLPRDGLHDEAASLITRVGRELLITSNHVRGETWTFLRHRAWHAAAVAFLDALERTERLRLVFVDEDLENDALHWLRRHDEREYSFVDATSFALMRSLRIREAFAFDGDFTAAGFVELRT
jgi:predicted nucleic acid-binding protein